LVQVELMELRRSLALVLAGLGLAAAQWSMRYAWFHLNLPSCGQAPSVAVPCDLSWPLPAGYLVEVVVLAVVAFVGVVMARYRDSGFISWFALGSLSAMKLLSAMGIVPFVEMAIGSLVVVPLLFLIPATILATQRRPKLASEVTGLVVGLLLQGGVMFCVIWLRSTG
jgi:hypothetical protein